MERTIDMQLMRYINIFDRTTKVSTNDCFVYNNTIYFAVPKKLIFKALGKNAENARMISGILRKKIRVVAMPEESDLSKDNEKKRIETLKKFVSEVVAPIEFSGFDLIDDVVNISGSRETKAILIGRDRSKEKELEDILKRNFGVKGLRIA